GTSCVEFPSARVRRRTALRMLLPASPRRLQGRWNCFPMKFRLVWVGSDDDGGGPPRLREKTAAPADYTPKSTYEQRDGVMLRRERLQNGRLRYTPLANFTARIVGDILRDDGEQERREFGMEADIGGCKVAFPISAVEFGRMNWVLRRLGPAGI